MRWKELIIGGSITLIVTVIGGLLVFYFTREEVEIRSEVLSYQIDRQVSFQGSDNEISIGSLRFANIGADPARNIISEFSVSNAEIVEFVLDAEDGAEITQTISDDRSSVSLDIENLLPNETVFITYLLSKEASVNFTMRSDNSIGSEGPIFSPEITRDSILNNFFGDFIPFLILISMVPLLFSWRFIRSIISRGSSKNNIGFVLLHSNQIEDAVEVLGRAIRNGEDGSYALANYAAGLAVQGDIEKSRKYLEAASILARTTHEQAICEFNESIIEHVAGNLDESVNSIQNALKHSKSAISEYIEQSRLYRGIIEENDEISAVIDSA